MRRLIQFSFAAIAAAILLNSCGPKVEDVLAKHRPAYDKVRAQLKDLASKVPSPGALSSILGGAVKLDPLPVYDGKNPANSNTAFFDLLVANDNNAKPSYDLLLTSNLAFGLGFTNVPSTLAESALDGRDKKMDANLEKWLGQFRYVVTTLPVIHQAAKATDDKTFAPGGVDLEYYLADLNSGEFKATGRIQAMTDSTVEFVYKNDGERRERLEAFANSTLFTATRKKLMDSLNAQTGGSFKAN